MCAAPGATFTVTTRLGDATVIRCMSGLVVAKLSTIRNGPTLPVHAVQSAHALTEAYYRHGPTPTSGCCLQLAKVFRAYSSRGRHCESGSKKATSFNVTTGLYMIVRNNVDSRWNH